MNRSMTMRLFGLLMLAVAMAFAVTLVMNMVGTFWGLMVGMFGYGFLACVFYFDGEGGC